MTDPEKEENSVERNGEHHGDRKRKKKKKATASETYAWACTTCSDKHRRCDGRRPCGYCIKIGAPPASCVDGEKRTIGRPKKIRSEEGANLDKLSPGGASGGGGTAPRRTSQQPPRVTSHPQVGGKRPPDLEQVRKMMEEAQWEVRQEKQQTGDKKQRRTGIDHEKERAKKEEEEEESEREQEILRIREEVMRDTAALGGIAGNSGVSGGSMTAEGAAVDIRSVLVRLEREITILKNSMLEMEKGQRLLYLRLDQLRQRQDIMANNLGYRLPSPDSLVATNTIPRTPPKPTTPPLPPPPLLSNLSSPPLVSTPHSPPVNSTNMMSGTTPPTSFGGGGGRLHLLDRHMYADYFNPVGGGDISETPQGMMPMPSQPRYPPAYSTHFPPPPPTSSASSTTFNGTHKTPSPMNKPP